MAETGAQQLTALIEKLRVQPGSKVELARNFDPGFRAGWLTREEGEQHLALGVELLAEYQDRLAAQDVHGLLIVLQGIDAAGKDGTIRRVISGVNPQGVDRPQLQGPLGRGAQPRLPLALRPLPARPRPDRDLQPLTL